MSSRQKLRKCWQAFGDVNLISKKNLKSLIWKETEEIYRSWKSGQKAKRNFRDIAI